MAASALDPLLDRATKADGGHLDAVGCGRLGHRQIARFALVVGGKPFEVADGHGGLVLLVVDAFRLALLFLRAHAAAHGRQGAGLFQRACGLEYFAALDVLDEFRDVDFDRAAGHAQRLRAVEAAVRLLHGLFERQAPVDLLVGAAAFGGVGLAHSDALNRHSVFGFHAVARFDTPRQFALCLYF